MYEAGINFPSKMSVVNKQRDSIEFVAKGHNLVLIGKAGTGKTFTVKNIVERCNSMGKTCAVTATTGIACTLYGPSKAMTIHRWSGIGDGRYEPLEIKAIVENNAKFKSVLDRIFQTDVLIIDEFSMLSKRALECLNAVCCLKNPLLYFGGMQVVLVGDIIQLPPVPCARYNEEGAYCFESNIFSKAFPHRIRLTDVHRQSDMRLVKAIEEISIGSVTDDTFIFMKALSRPLIHRIDENMAVRLFATNDLVDDFNREQILDFPGPLHDYLSIDTGEKKCLSEVMACRMLWLKIGIPFILIKNLSDQLVNGLRGSVYDILGDGKVLVEFPKMKEIIYIEKVRFEVFDPRRNVVVAVREQIPLKAAFALTIHKSQGMTLDSVQVDCREIFKAGQLGVAIGRTRTLAGLRVINFSKRACMKQPEKIIKFWAGDDSVNTKEDRTCCNGFAGHKTDETIFTVEDLQDIFVIQDTYCQSDSEDDLDDDFNEVIASISDDEQCKDIILPEDLNIKEIISKIRAPIVVSPYQYENNEILSRMIWAKVEVFAKQQYSKITSLLNECKCSETGKIVSKDLGDFYTKQHTYTVGSEFKMQCFQLFDYEDRYTFIHQRISCNILVGIREYVIQSKAKHVDTPIKPINKRTVTEASRARIRYVGGYCIAKVRHKFVTKKATHRFSLKKKDSQEYEKAKCAIDILNRLKQGEQSVFEKTDEPDSLLDISRRQNLNRGLTNIEDCVFKFFIQLTEKCLDILTNDNLNEMSGKMFTECQTILETSDLYEKFVQLCSRPQETYTEFEEDPFKYLISFMTLQVSMIESIFHHIIKYHLMVMFNQFRKDTLDSFQIGKKMAHRKQLRVSVSSDCKKITSNGPIKGRKQKKTQSKSPNQSKETEPSVDHVQTSDDLETEPQPGTSTQHEVDNTILHSTFSTICDSNSDSDEIKCKVCDTAEKETLWIQCESCNSWLHRNCAGLRHHMKWKKYQKKSSKYFCWECE